jgi:hypothetical protein
MPTSLQRAAIACAGTAVLLLLAHVAGLGTGSAPRVVRPDPPLAPALEAPRQPLHPVPSSPVRALPRMAQSDAAVRNALGRIRGGPSLLPLLAADNLIRRFVSTVHRMPRATLPATASPLAGGVVPNALPLEQARVLGEGDFRRYEPLVRAVEGLDTQAAIGLYWRLYPLFEQAYGELAPDPPYFNDRLVEVIEHLLQTPSTAAPLRVLPVGSVYRFEDPRLEACSAGQKLLLRMGPANAARIAEKLRQVRKLLALRPPGA